MADQSDNVIFQVEDAENVEVMFEEQRIIFTCSQPKLINNKKSNEMKKYRNEIDLFGKVKPAVRILYFLAQSTDRRLGPNRTLNPDRFICPFISETDQNI